MSKGQVSYKAKKRSLSMKQNLKSWNKGTNQKVIASPSNILTKSSRNGLILT